MEWVASAQGRHAMSVPAHEEDSIDRELCALTTETGKIPSYKQRPSMSQYGTLQHNQHSLP